MSDGQAGRPTDGRLTSLRSALRRVLGMPDYQAYLEHLRTHHPGCPVPSEKEFFQEFVRARYAGGPTRCC